MTEENRREYVDAYINFFLNESVNKQFEAFARRVLWLHFCETRICAPAGTVDGAAVFVRCIGSPCAWAFFVQSGSRHVDMYILVLSSCVTVTPYAAGGFRVGRQK